MPLLPPPPPPAGGPRLSRGLAGVHPLHLGLAAGAGFRSCSRTWGRLGRRGGGQGRATREEGVRQANADGGFWGKFPVKAAGTAGSLAFAGDFVAQLIETYVAERKMGEGEKVGGGKAGGAEKESATGSEGPRTYGYDVPRALRMTSYGFLVYGPILDKWFFTLDSLMPGGPSVGTLAKKVIATQTLLNPCLLLLVFAYHYTLMGRVGELPTKYTRDLVPTMVNGWKFWLPASVVNFAVVPLPARVLFMSSCSIVWNTYLSMTVTR